METVLSEVDILLLCLKFPRLRHVICFQSLFAQSKVWPRIVTEIIGADCFAADCFAADKALD